MIDTLAPCKIEISPSVQELVGKSIVPKTCQKADVWRLIVRDHTRLSVALTKSEKYAKPLQIVIF